MKALIDNENQVIISGDSSRVEYLSELLGLEIIDIKSMILKKFDKSADIIYYYDECDKEYWQVIRPRITISEK